jgi:hypothetical protein
MVITLNGRIPGGYEDICILVNVMVSLLAYKYIITTKTHGGTGNPDTTSYLLP